MSEYNCFDCKFLNTFKPRPDEVKNYGFDKTGYGCKAKNHEGYISDPTKPPCGMIKFTRTDKGQKT